MKPFVKIINPGMLAVGGKYREVFCKIEFNKIGRLMISGVVGPLSGGGSAGGAGQILRLLAGMGRFRAGWDPCLAENFTRVWRQWHLNDLRPGCIHQEADKAFQRKTLLQALEAEPCPICGYKWGSSWQTREVPTEVLEFLKELPEAKKTPAWV
jgi:hypothetical protein